MTPFPVGSSTTASTPTGEGIGYTFALDRVPPIQPAGRTIERGDNWIEEALGTTGLEAELLAQKDQRQGELTMQ